MASDSTNHKPSDDPSDPKDDDVDDDSTRKNDDLDDESNDDLLGEEMDHDTEANNRNTQNEKKIYFCTRWVQN